MEGSLTPVTVDGDRCLVMEDGQIRVSINVDHGAHLYELTDLRSGANVLYEDPAGPREYRVGGWYELFPNAGSPCVVEGRKLSWHGDIQYRPWSSKVLAADPDLVSVEFSATSADLPFGIRRTVTLAGGGEVAVSETITNLSDSPLPYLWGHHVTFGAQMMGPSCRVTVPDVDMFAEPFDNPLTPYLPGARGRLDAVPTRDGSTVDLSEFPEAPFHTMLFADDLPEYRCGIWSGDLAVGVSLEWDGEAFPALWFWATNKGTPSQPELVACALEPQASTVHPLSAAVEAAAAPVLDAGASRDGWLRVRVGPDAIQERG
jgi:galactose mutarotase-like enzyme